MSKGISSSEEFSYPVSSADAQFLAECATNADRFLQEIGLEPCACKWTDPAFKSEQTCIYRILAYKRDHEGLVKKTGEIAFLLNAKWFFKKAIEITNSEHRVYDIRSSRYTVFNTYYMECQRYWPKYNPEISLYPTYMGEQLGYKVRYKSKDTPEKFDANSLYEFHKLEEYEAELLGKGTDLSPAELRTALHIKSGYSKTKLDKYFRWKQDKSPVSIEADNSPVENLPLTPSERAGKSHLREPEEQVEDNEFINNLLDKLNQVMDDPTIYENSDIDPEQARPQMNELIYQLALNGNCRKVLEQYPDLKQIFHDVKRKLSKIDDTEYEILFGRKRTKSKARVTHKIASVVRIDSELIGAEDDEEEVIIPSGAMDVTRFVQTRR